MSQLRFYCYIHIVSIIKKNETNHHPYRIYVRVGIVPRK